MSKSKYTETIYQIIKLDYWYKLLSVIIQQGVKMSQYVSQSKR